MPTTLCQMAVPTPDSMVRAIMLWWVIQVAWWIFLLAGAVALGAGVWTRRKRLGKILMIFGLLTLTAVAAIY